MKRTEGIHFRLTERQKEMFDFMAQKNGMTLSRYICWLLERDYEKYTQEVERDRRRKERENRKETQD